MPRLELFQDEELVARFRPHALSFLPHYLGAASWLVGGAAGSAVALYAGPPYGTALGILTVITLGLLAALVRRHARGASAGYAGFAFLLGAGAAAAVPLFPPAEATAWRIPLLFAAGLSLLRLGGWELHRLRRVHFLTSNRLVARTGLGHRREESLPLERVREVRGHRGPIGQLFGYGDLVLVLGTAGRGKNNAEDTWVLAGIARMWAVKYDLEELLQESRLPARERRRRGDDRRLRESMRRLASWMREDRARSGLSL